MLVKFNSSNCLFCVFFLLFISCCSPSIQACTQQDYNSLISFSLDNSPQSNPLTWNSTTDCCKWEGIVCDSNGYVTHLSLPYRGLQGDLSPSLENLTHLTYLNLSHNSLSGSLSVNFFDSLTNLEILDLCFNTLSGELPSSLPSSINTIDLSTNHFNGTIQTSFLQPAQNLSSFNVSNNSFTGSIPSSICSNSSSIRLLDFSSNHFSGGIPQGLGACSKLQVFRAGLNGLTGTIPDDIYNATALQEISLPLNQLQGSISDGIVHLTNLTILQLFSNHLAGGIPENIGNLSNLQHLELHVNNLTGSLPVSLMNCINLQVLNLRVNLLFGDISALNFSNLQQLRTLDLGNNNFTGVFPPSLYTCKSLTAVRFASNQLVGQIMPGIVALQSLSFLSISTNNLTNFTGAIRILKGCKNLSALILSKNFYDEEIPEDDSIDGFQNLQVLALGGCRFTGTVPIWINKLKKLEVLDLSYNALTGTIPTWLGTLPSLFYVDLSNNHLDGGFPPIVGEFPVLSSVPTYTQLNRTYLELPVFVQPNNVTNLQPYNQLSNLPPAIYLANNTLSGDIPSEIGQLVVLHALDLSGNDFSGSIPDQISELINLEILDLSRNNLSGEIPASLKNLHFLRSFSVANNSLEGPIPTGGQFDTFSNSSFLGNPGLCGAILQHSCNGADTGYHSSSKDGPNKKLIIGLILGICFGIGLSLTVALWILSKRKILPRRDSEKVDLDTISSHSNRFTEDGKDTSMVILFTGTTSEVKDLTIADILNATDNFNQENIIGCGGFGLVYRATLANGTKLAVKKLSGDMGLMEREFKAEVEALSTAQHKNLVSLRGYCIHDGFRLLIYSYMENGSLDYWLHERTEGASQLDWPTRLRIAQGACCGLAYMHQICEPHIIHRDIKSSNILLDEQFEAHVADFGLSRLILPYHTHVTTELVGTLGYIPPEYGQAWVATLRGDVYSFGVVMLELLTGKRPVEVFKPKLSRELVGWVQQMRSEAKQDQIFDPLLKGKGFEEEMLQVLDVACMCVNLNPFKRPTIKEVGDWLENVGVNRESPKKEPFCSTEL
ncbi:Leucine-rich repeat [Dillenia turbinata]|uniref:non-specific serine/threonine protein kinase n=1 Tax=Dillenia turbinata TaxID=194707 RepID=A0AAN8URN7_9MAGN